MLSGYTQGGRTSQPCTPPFTPAVEPERSGRPHPLPTMTTTLRGALACDWAPALEATARAIAAVIATCYVAGLMAGAWLHRLNDHLAQVAAGRRPAVPPVEPARNPCQLPPLPAVALPCAPAPAPRRPAAVAAPALDQLTVAQLRSLARTRGHRGSHVRDARRCDLLHMLA